MTHAFGPSVPTPGLPADSSVRPLVVFIPRPDGSMVPAPYLLSMEDTADLFRLRESGCRFYKAAIGRYRGLGLRSVRVGRRVWFRLDDVLAFLNSQQRRLDA